jgi:hypothetical protein
MGAIRPLLMLVLCAILAPMAPAQPEGRQRVNRPKFADRVVAAFDFENLSSPIPVPPNWVRGQHDPKVPRVRPGFPIWNLALLDTTYAHSGNASVKLPTRGGSTSLLLRRGALPVLPGADYRVAAWVRTKGLVHARACIEVTLLNDRGEPLPGQTFRSKSIRAEREWTLVDVEIRNANSAFLQLDLLLLQPSQYLEAVPRYEELVTLEDVSGSAWFDDVTVAQLPQIDIGLNTPGNIIKQTSRPGITVVARDLTGEDLTVKVRILGIDGDLVDSAEFAFRGGRMSRAWEPSLTKLGWYRAIVEISDGVRTVGADTLDFVWVLGDRSSDGTEQESQQPGAGLVGGSADRTRFGVIVDEHDPALLAALPTAVANMGVGSVSLPAWWDTATPGGVEAVNLLLPVLRQLRDSWLDITLVLDRVPGGLADELGISDEDVLAVLEAPQDQWGPTMLPLMDRLGQLVQRWQAGRVASEKLITDPLAAERLDLFEYQLKRLVPEATLAMPWPFDMPLDASLLTGEDRSLVLAVPGEVPPAGIASAALYWAESARGSRPFQVVLQSQDATAFGYRYSAEDFARRALEAWAAFGPVYDTPENEGGSIAIAQPWVWTGGVRGDLRVRPEAAVMRNLVERLIDRSGAIDLVLAPGVRAVLLEPRIDAPEGRGAALAVWSAPGQRIPESIDLLLGQKPVRLIDIFGNERPLETSRTEALDLPFHRIPIGPAPVFLEGVDAELIRFLTTLALDPPLLEASNADHQHDLVVTNPWPIPIQGEIYIVEPGGFSSPDGTIDRSWHIGPRVIPFLMEAGEIKHFPISITFSPFEESGRKDLILDVDLNASREYGIMRIKRTMMLGSDRLRINVSYRLGPGPGGPHVYVDADIVNVGDEPLTCRLSVFASGFPRNSASVTALAPGQTTRRTFLLQDGVAKLSGKVVAVSVEVPDLRLRLNRSVEID